MSSQTSAAGGAPGAPVIKFRNYQPRDAALVGGGGAKPQGQAAGAAAASAPAQPARAPVAVALAPPPAPSVLLAQQEAAESAQLMAKAKDVDSVVIAPKKPNWDLKRDVAPRLDVLERRTQRAIADLLRERVTAAALAKAAAGGAGAGAGGWGAAGGPAGVAGAPASGSGASPAGAPGSAADLDAQFESGGIDAAALARAVMEQGEGGEGGDVGGDNAGTDDVGRGAGGGRAPGKRRRHEGDE